jgi:hypothetical protein
MNKIIFRNDDVNPSSNLKHIKEIYNLINIRFPNVEIYSCINIFGKKNPTGLVYPKTNIKYDNRLYYDIDSIFDFRQLPNLYNIVSHGLFHFSHAKVTYETQRFSILASCNLLKTNIFVPPYWEWNEKTIKICKLNNINLWTDNEWINLDREKIDTIHNHYCFHSWKFTPESFFKKINNE